MITSQTIHKTVTVNSTIENLWWKWTTHEGLLSFFGADNKVELKLGGSYEIYFLMDNPEGLRGGEGNKIISFLPNKMLSFTWNAPPQYESIRNHKHKTWVVVQFKLIDIYTIEVSLDHLGWLEGEDWNEVYNYFDKAWDTVMDWLEESCKA